MSSELWATCLLLFLFIFLATSIYKYVWRNSPLFPAMSNRLVHFTPSAAFIALCYGVRYEFFCEFLDGAKLVGFFLIVHGGQCLTFDNVVDKCVVVCEFSAYTRRLFFIGRDLSHFLDDVRPYFAGECRDSSNTLRFMAIVSHCIKFWFIESLFFGVCREALETGSNTARCSWLLAAQRGDNEGNRVAVKLN